MYQPGRSNEPGEGQRKGDSSDRHTPDRQGKNTMRSGDVYEHAYSTTKKVGSRNVHSERTDSQSLFYLADRFL